MTSGGFPQNISIEMDGSSLNLGLRDLSIVSRLQALVVIDAHQLHPFEATIHQLPKKITPSILRFLKSLNESSFGIVLGIFVTLFITGCASVVYKLDYKERYSPGTVRASACIGKIVDDTPSHGHFMNNDPRTPTGERVGGGPIRFTRDLRDVIFDDLRESRLFESIFPKCDNEYKLATFQIITKERSVRA